VCSRRRRPRFGIATEDRSQRNPRSRLLMQVPSTARRRLTAGVLAAPGMYNAMVNRAWPGTSISGGHRALHIESRKGYKTGHMVLLRHRKRTETVGRRGAHQGALLPIVAISLTMSVRCAGIISSRVQIGAAARGREPRRMATAAAEIRLLVGLHGAGRDPRGPIGRAGPAYCPQSTGRAAPQFPDEDWPHDLNGIVRNSREREQKRHVSNPTAAGCVVTWSRGLPTNDAMCISDRTYTCLIIS
jgi:hypothetical protein